MMTRAERREAIDDVKSDLEELAADLMGMRFELEELRERIAAARAERARLKARLAELRQAK
jgi:hypothetical protein